MASYLETVKEVLDQFDTVTIMQVPRAKNVNADVLARHATGLEERLLKIVPIEILESPSIDKPEQVGSIAARPCWMNPSSPSFAMKFSLKISSKHAVYSIGQPVNFLIKASCIRNVSSQQVIYA